MLFDFTFLRYVSKKRVKSAWQQQMNYSCSFRYKGFEADRDKLIEILASPILNGETQTVQIVGDDTLVMVEKVHKGTILGRHFQRAFLTLFFGENAVTEELRYSLSKGSTNCTENVHKQCNLFN